MTPGFQGAEFISENLQNLESATITLSAGCFAATAAPTTKRIQITFDAGLNTHKFGIVSSRPKPGQFSLRVTLIGVA